MIKRLFALTPSTFSRLSSSTSTTASTLRYPFRFSSSQPQHNNHSNNTTTNNEKNAQQTTPPQNQSSFEAQEIKIGRNQNVQVTPPVPDKDTNDGSEEMSLTYKLALLSVGGAALFILYKLNEMQSKLKKLEDVRVSHRGEAEVGKKWYLVGTDGKEITEQSFLGEYYLVYFGFCHCPDICPANLIKIRKALSQITDKTNLKIRLLFVSVDFERDSLQDIDRFLRAYDASIVGATAKDETQMKETLKSFKVVANKVFYEADDEEKQVMQAKYGDDSSKIYTMDHTTNTYLMGRNGQFLTFFDGNRSEAQLSEGILGAIQADVQGKPVPQ